MRKVARIKEGKGWGGGGGWEVLEGGHTVEAGREGYGMRECK